MRKINLTMGLALFVVACVLTFSRASEAAVLTYPGAAPCDTTLQICINNSLPGDEIQIATNDRINESLTLSGTFKLTNASGFTPMIGGVDSTNTKTISVEDAGGGIETHIEFSNINFDNARVSVSFSGGSGHTFFMHDCILTNRVANNNDEGVGISLRTSADVVLQHNIISSSGSAVSVYGSLDPSKTASAKVFGNELTGTTAIQSYQGINLRNDSNGILNIDIQSNVIHDVGGCFCGGPGGITVDQNGTGELNVNIINNTIADVVGGGASVYTYAPSSTGILNLNLFNNILTGSAEFGFILPAFSASLVVHNDYNNTFDNALGDHWGGYTAGPNNLSVDPEYMDKDMLDFRLHSASPLIGTATSSITGVTITDLDRADSQRIVGSIDFGAFEAAGDLEVVAVSDLTQAEVGETVKFTFTTNNKGPDAVLTDLNISVVGGDAAAVVPTKGDCRLLNNNIACDFSEMQSGDNAIVTFDVTATTTGSLVVTAVASGDRPDSVDSNNETALSVNILDAGSGSLTSGTGGCQLVQSASQTNSLLSLVIISMFVLGNLMRAVFRCK